MTGCTGCLKLGQKIRGHMVMVIIKLSNCLQCEDGDEQIISHVALRKSPYLMESVTSFVKWRIWPWRFPKFLVWILLGSEVKAGLGWSPFGAEMNQVLCKRRKRECQGEEEGQSIQETPILDKHEKREPAEVKSRGHQGRKRVCGLLVKIKDSGRWETQPPTFTLGLTCQNKVLSQWVNTPSSLHSQIFQFLGANVWSFPSSNIRWSGYFRRMLPYKCLKSQVSDTNGEAVWRINRTTICTVRGIGVPTPARGILRERFSFFSTTLIDI